MDIELRCNRLSCRRVLSHKAVVGSGHRLVSVDEGSHIFCVECANELFNAARICPACETSLLEPDDVVVASLNPSNDYKTSVLSGLSPSIILEICSRAIAFWQYQIHQENFFQQAVVRNMNDKISHLQKQLDNVIREASNEISLLNGKVSDLEHDLEIERRKCREMQETSREKDKEYVKLKAQCDRMKRKALLAPSVGQRESDVDQSVPVRDEIVDKVRPHGTFGTNIGNVVDLGAVVGGMEAHGIQRTPITGRVSLMSHGQHGTGAPFWQQQGSSHSRKHQQRQSLPTVPNGPRSYRDSNASDRSDSANEVENLLAPNNLPRRTMNQNGWGSTSVGRSRPAARAFSGIPAVKRSNFKPVNGSR